MDFVVFLPADLPFIEDLTLETTSFSFIFFSIATNALPSAFSCFFIRASFLNFSVLYFEVDWVNSKKNFYGELIYKKFTIPKGTPIKGTIKLEQGTEQMSQGIPNKIMKLTLSIYTQQLDELGMRPKLGDYFGIGNRFYEIYDRTIEDVGVGNVMIDRKQMRLDYKCVQADDEVMFRDAWGNDNLGTESKLRP